MARERKMKREKEGSKIFLLSLLVLALASCQTVLSDEPVTVGLVSERLFVVDENVGGAEVCAEVMEPLSSATQFVKNIEIVYQDRTAIGTAA